MKIDGSVVHTIMKTMNTECDRKVVRGVLSHVLDKNQMLACGIKPAIAKVAFKKVFEASAACMRK